MSDGSVLTSQDRRRYARTPHADTASVIIGRWPRQRALDCQVKDLSDIGASIELKDLNLAMGQTATLKVKANASL